MTRPITKLKFSNSLPPVRQWGTETFLIYDRRLDRHVSRFSKWRKGFSASYGVASGEDLKDIAKFPGHIARIEKLARALSSRRLVIVVAGGGSVGDFGAFVASIYKRGVRLIHVPTTWLAAIDSAHGGKTALNVGGAKNQIGTFYPASEVHLVRSILTAQPETRAQDAFAELVKIALIDGGRWVKPLLQKTARDKSKLLWNMLRPAIEAKYKIVRQDPEERKGLRQVLNLGHTLGHVLEASLGLSHGEAVAQGLFFALTWSHVEGYLSRKHLLEANHLLRVWGFVPLVEWNQYGQWRPSRARVRELLLQDKKRESTREVSFIYLKGFGHPVRLPVLVDDIIDQAAAQGWIR